MKKMFSFGIMTLMLILASISVAAQGIGANVRVLHASQDAPAVDVWVNGGKAFENLAFNEITGFANLPRGTYNVQVVPTGATEPVVIEADLPLKNARDYTVIAVNFLDSIEPIVLTDISKRVPFYSAGIRFVHASPDAPAVDIAVKNGPVLFRNVEFKESKGYIKVPQGTYDLEVRVAGTDIVALEIPGVELNRRTAYTAFATGTLAENTLGAKLVIDRQR